MDASGTETGTTDLESTLRITSDNFLTRVVRLQALEEQKRQLPVADMVDLADEVENLTREILDWAIRQAALARTAAQDPGKHRPIAIVPPRRMALVLDEWRTSERALEGLEPGTAKWESARADVERLREEYSRAYRAMTGRATSD